MAGEKRPREGDDTSHRSKHSKLEDDRIAAPSVGANLIQVNGKTCTHEVAWPPGEYGSHLPPDRAKTAAAKEYAFSLDPFQQTAINALERGHSVLVAAHTSAGKTVVAEYAFAMALRDNQRVIYTSPLKALSNQKYRQLYEEFQDVGLMTGDVTINPNASCLVMTTEILRSMLYRGSEVVREVQLIVYDEIHYLRDKERGVVWEESIIMAPRSARFVFLSATIPNAREFAEWIAKTHRSPCHVVYTDYRPTPLQHYLFPSGAQGLYMVVDEKGTFREDNFQKAIGALTEAAAEAKGRPGAKSGKSGKRVGCNLAPDEKPDIYKIVRMCMERNYDPLIVFSFSKKECENLAKQMVDMDLNDAAEKKVVEGVFWNAVDILSEQDRRLPHIHAILPMLKRGVGVHHSGLLPILKEVIEILFQEGLIKVLFATETFSTGLNMPAKTVVFTSARKYDGGAFRWVSSGEYIQMSGRAGRRGLDDKGVVILMLDTKMEPSLAKEMVKGAPDTLHSEFHLGYNMLLNMLRVEGANPEALLRASYRQFQMERSMPELERKVQQLEGERDAVHVAEEEHVTTYLELQQQLAAAKAAMRAVVNQPRYILPFLQPGRLVNIAASASGDSSMQEGASPSRGAAQGGRAVWGAVINFERVGKKEGTDAGDGESHKKRKEPYIVDVLVNCASGSIPGTGPKRRAVCLPSDEEGVPSVVPVRLEEVEGLSSVRIYIPKDLRQPEARALGIKAMNEVQKRFKRTLPELDPESDMSVTDSDYRKSQRKSETLEGLLSKHPLASSTTLDERLTLLRHKQMLAEKVRLARKEVKAAQNLILQAELKARRRVLRRLGYVDSDGVVTVKGRAAAEIQSADELVLTELMFNGVFKELKPEQVVALVSCTVWQERAEAGQKVRQDMQGPFAALTEAARTVAKVAVDCKMTMDIEDYATSFRPDIIDAVSGWCQGATFAKILTLTDIFEGSLVRAIRRIEEVLRQLSSAAQVIGEGDLEDLFEKSKEKIKRDIIFAASLYL
ncbi:hypothetical protein ABBQ32_003293 [Trebouxia sp. C0010 RCD-2024]